MSKDYERVLIGVDGSKEAELAFRKAVEVTKRNEGTLVIAHIVDTRSYQGFENFDGNLPEKTRKEIKSTLQEYQTIALNAGVLNVETLLEYGSPKKNLARNIPENKKIDLIVLGATGLNAIERLFIGSVSEFVTRNAVCDVLIVRTDLDHLPFTE